VPSRRARLVLWLKTMEANSKKPLLESFIRGGT
jgi:hypothetical protein